MNIKDIVQLLNAQIVYECPGCNTLDLCHVVAADLMSDIMIDTQDGSVLITGLMNPQVIRTAEMMNVHVVIFVRGKTIPESVISLAQDRGITLVECKESMFNVCGILYQSGLIGGK